MLFARRRVLGVPGPITRNGAAAATTTQTAVGLPQALWLPLRPSQSSPRSRSSATAVHVQRGVVGRQGLTAPLRHTHPLARGGATSPRPSQ